MPCESAAFPDAIPLTTSRLKGADPVATCTKATRNLREAIKNSHTGYCKEHLFENQRDIQESLQHQPC